MPLLPGAFSPFSVPAEKGAANRTAHSGVRATSSLHVLLRAPTSSFCFFSLPRLMCCQITVIAARARKCPWVLRVLGQAGYVPESPLSNAGALRLESPTSKLLDFLTPLTVLPSEAVGFTYCPSQLSNGPKSVCPASLSMNTILTLTFSVQAPSQGNRRKRPKVDPCVGAVLPPASEGGLSGYIPCLRI